MEGEEEQKRKEGENREMVLCPVRRHEAIDEEKYLEKPAENILKMPRRWYVY